MTRQVRLDDDVAAFVASRSGGLSLSGSTNAILRLIAAGDGRQGETDQNGASSARIVPGEFGPEIATIHHSEASRSPGATTGVLPEADGPEVSARIVRGDWEVDDATIHQPGRPNSPSATRARLAKRGDLGARCSHPALGAGRRCVVCGSVTTLSRSPHRPETSSQPLSAR